MALDKRGDEPEEEPPCRRSDKLQHTQGGGAVRGGGEHGEKALTTVSGRSTEKWRIASEQQNRRSRLDRSHGGFVVLLRRADRGAGVRYVAG